MGRTEDWSEFIPPERQQTVELAGRWKHGWIPLDATAISSKMKGKSGGKRWWDKGGSGGNRKAVGVPKKGGKPYKKPTGWARTNELDKMDMPTRTKIGDLNKAGKFREAQQEALASRARNKKRLARVDAIRNKMLTTKEVPSAKARIAARRAAGGDKPHPLTRSRKPISQMSARERVDEANRADKMAGLQPDRSAEWEALVRLLRGSSGKA